MNTVSTGDVTILVFSSRFDFDLIFLQRILRQFDFNSFVRKFHTSVRRVPVGKCVQY